jgi:hypothetical protein
VIVYEKVTTVDHAGHRETVLLDDPHLSTDGKWHAGWDVDKTGTLTGRFHVIDVATVHSRTPMKMNLHYGELEKA